MMLFFVVAMPAEAKPLISRYALRRVEPSPFPLYQGSETVLIVSGMGRDDALVATAYLLTRYNPADTDLLLNVGICAAAPQYAIGETLIAHTLRDGASGRSIFPDMRYSHPFNEVALTSFDSPQETQGDAVEAADMEAFQVAKAALHFITTAQLLVAKSVSDHFKTDLPSKEAVNAWMVQLLEDIEPLIHTYEMRKSGKIHYSEALSGAVEQLRNALLLTQTQLHQLYANLNYYILRHKREPLLPKYVQNRHKKEQKDAFNKLLSLLAS